MARAKTRHVADFRRFAMDAWTQRAAEGALGAPFTAGDMDILIEEQSPLEHAVFVRAGHTEMLARWRDGGSRVVRLLTAPTLVGVMEWSCGIPVHVTSLRCVAEATVHRIPFPRVDALLDAESALCREALADQCTGLMVTSIAALFPLEEAEAQLATLLSAYAGVLGVPDGSMLRLPIRRTQADLAESVGASERTISRVLQRWQADGVLCKRQGLYSVDPERLWALGGELSARGRPLMEAWQASRRTSEP